MRSTVRADSVLGRLYSFFELSGAERLVGFDHSYFDGLSNVILTETERIPLSSAISKFMLVYRMNYDMGDAEYKTLYLSLRSSSPDDKLSAMKRLERIRGPNYY